MILAINKNGQPAPISLQNYNTQPLAKGGESELYSITTANFTNMVAKVFLPQYRTDYKRDKINYLIQNNPNKAGDNDVVWPTHSLWENGNFIGFLMPKVEGDKLEILCQPAPNSDKQKDKFIQKYPQWQRFLPDQPQAMNLRLKLCYNLLAAVEKLHKTNQYVLVDLKPDNVMVRADGFLSIIDTDSLQICQNGVLKYPANVCTPEYTPAEYYTGIDLKKQAVAASWDYFSLAIVVYRLLLGIHPFAASCTGQYQHLTSLDELIKNKLLPILPALKPHFLAIPQPHQRFLLLPEFIQNYLSQSLQTAAQRPTLQDFIPQLYQFIMNPAARASLSTPIKKQNPFNIEWWNDLSDKRKDTYFKIAKYYKFIRNPIQKQKFLSAEWWNHLSEEWKTIFIKNTYSNPQDKEFLNKIQYLTKLTCSFTQISNLDPLDNLKSLTELICRNTQIYDLTPLRNLSNLTYLDCSSTEINNLEPLRNLSNLTYLDCSSTEINSLEPLHNLSNLTKLRCSNTQISSLEPLQNLSNLTYLSCSYTQISNLEPLRNLSNLTELHCTKTQISNLEPLRNLSKLRELYYGFTRISSLEPLRNLQNLTKLNLKSISQSEKQIFR